MILAALRDKRSQKQHMSSDLAVPSSVSGAPDNEVTFLESIPESLSGEFDSQEFQTRKPPTRKDPGEEDPEVREDTDEEA